MGSEWQFGTEWRAGRAAANGEDPAEIVDGAASACKSAHGKLRESVSTGREHTDGSAGLKKVVEKEAATTRELGEIQALQRMKAAIELAEQSEKEQALGQNFGGVPNTVKHGNAPHFRIKH